MSGILYGVSVGPGDPELMTLKAVKTIQKCPVIAVPHSGADELVALNIARQSVPELDEKEVIELYMPMTRDKAELESTRNEATRKVTQLLEEGKDIAFLTLGDASIYSTYSYIHKRVLAQGFPAQIIPGVPSFCAVAARLNEGLTEAHQPLHIIPASYSGVDEGLSWTGTKVLMKTGKSLEKVKSRLRERKLYEHAKMVQKCGMEGERIFQSLDDADEYASYFSIIVVKD
ncbi:precorrin-2 C(20)-methyltransferase [Oscillospiraceae bacterium PP1C4]